MAAKLLQVSPMPLLLLLAAAHLLQLRQHHLQHGTVTAVCQLPRHLEQQCEHHADVSCSW